MRSDRNVRIRDVTPRFFPSVDPFEWSGPNQDLYSNLFSFEGIAAPWATAGQHHCSKKVLGRPSSKARQKSDSDRIGTSFPTFLCQNV